jgi:hypothetical protein
MSRFEAFMTSRKGWAVIFLFFLGAYLGGAGDRLRRHSEHNHYVYLAEGWLDGRLALKGQPPNENDWARVEVLTLRDGRVVKGLWKVGVPDRFLRMDGGAETITADEIAGRDSIRYVSFPPLPAVLMLPFVAIAKLRFNDVIFTAVWAALNPLLLFGLLRTLVKRGHSQRSVSDDLWLTALLGIGSVYYFSSVTGQVWFTAHVVGVTCVIAYAWAALDARHPWAAGLFLGLGFACRPSLGFAFPFFVLEAVRMAGGFGALWRERRVPTGLLLRLVKFGVPAAAVLAVLFLHNYARFGHFTEFGHKYLNIAWQERMQRWGEFNYHFLSRNLAAALVLTPRILATYPFVKVSVHGMSLFITSPNLAWLLGPRTKSPLAPALWLTVLATALPGLLYHNSGYVQFGYRFSLDYMVYLVLLLAIGGRPLTKLFKVALVVAVAINLFGAIVFDRFSVFTYDDTFFPHGWN